MWAVQFKLLEHFWRILLYVPDYAIAKLYVTLVKFSQIQGNGRTFRHIDAIASSVKFSNSVYCRISRVWEEVPGGSTQDSSLFPWVIGDINLLIMEENYLIFSENKPSV